MDSGCILNSSIAVLVVLFQALNMVSRSTVTSLVVRSGLIRGQAQWNSNPPGTHRGRGLMDPFFCSLQDSAVSCPADLCRIRGEIIDICMLGGGVDKKNDDLQKYYDYDKLHYHNQYFLH